MAFSASRRLKHRRGSLQEKAGSSEYHHLDCNLRFDLEPVLRKLSSQLPAKKLSKAHFASLGLINPVSGQKEDRQKSGRCKGKSQKGQTEAFMIASASENSEVAGVPAWRVTLGNIAAGATAGATVEAALYPIDTIKTRLQASISGGGLGSLLKGGGSRALYAGIWGNLAGVMPASAIFMGIYEPVKQHVLERVPPEKDYLGALSGGALAGLAASIVRVPTEVVKQRLQTGEFTGALKAISSITKVEGLRGLFAGYGSFLLRDLPFDAIEFVAYEQLKKSYKASLSEIREPNSLETSVIGAAAGAFTGVVTTPLDVIKTRLMTQGSRKTYSGVFDCAQKIWQQEGSAAFLKGWQPRVIWIGLGGCVFFTALEEAKKLYIPKIAQKQGSTGH